MAWCIPAAGHIGPALREHTERAPGGAEGPLALSPQQCEAWIESLTAPIQSHRTKPLKQLKILTFKSFTRFFSCEGCPPPVCLRCSPGLFRHGGGAASCHTSSMAAKPHLALTKNSSPTTLANGRRTTQIAGSRGQRSRSRRARRETPAPRTGRNTPTAPSVRTTKPGWCRACRRKHRRRGGFQCGFWRPWGRRRKILRWR